MIRCPECGVPISQDTKHREGCVVPERECETGPALARAISRLDAERDDG